MKYFVTINSERKLVTSMHVCMKVCMSVIIVDMATYCASSIRLNTGKLISNHRGFMDIAPFSQYEKCQENFANKSSHKIRLIIYKKIKRMGNYN